MKKLVFIAIAFAALAFAGCEQEKFVGASQDGVLTVLSAGREAGPATKSALTEDGDNYWSVGDQILVAWAGQKPEVFKSKEKEPSETAKFQGFMPVNNSGDENKYAIYPAEDGNIVNADGSYDLQYHAEQDGVEGTYDPSAFLAVAQSSDNNLSFYNVLGLLRLNFVDADIRKVTLRPGATPDEEEEEEIDPDLLVRREVDTEDVEEPGEEEPVEEPVDNGFIPGGILNVEGQTPELVSWSEELSEVILKAPKGKNFVPGTDYYLAVPPCVLENGVTFEIMHSDGSSSLVSINGPVEVERSKIHDVTLDSDPYIPVSEISFDSEEEEVEVGETITLEPTVKPKKATDKTLVWSSEDEDIATVDENGVVTGVAEGTVVITAKALGEDEEEVEAEGQITIIVTCPWVDLGLPSGTLWAKNNVGAESPEEAGDYFAWGETEPKDEYSWETYLLRADSMNLWGEDISFDDFPDYFDASYLYLYVNKYTFADSQYPSKWYAWSLIDDDEYSELIDEVDGEYLIIDDEEYDADEYPYYDCYEFCGDDVKYFSGYDYVDDAASVNLGEKWITPSHGQWAELMEYCDWEWTDDYEGTGVAGYIVSGTEEGYEDASIFLPITGYMYGDTLYYEYWTDCPAGYYWADETSWIYSDNSCLAYLDDEEYFTGGMFEDWSYGYIDLLGYPRYIGLPVRPVIKAEGFEGIDDDDDDVDISDGSGPRLMKKSMRHHSSANVRNSFSKPVNIKKDLNKASIERLIKTGKTK